jgi:hypothetical protein
MAPAQRRGWSEPATQREAAEAAIVRIKALLAHPRDPDARALAHGAVMLLAARLADEAAGGHRRQKGR